MQATRKDFAAWVSLVDGKVVCEPDYRTSMIRVTGTLASGVTWRVEFSALQVTDKGTFYARFDDWNAVQVKDSTAFHFFGKGARDVQNWKTAEDMLALLA